jgi:hypothetical protein
MSENGKPSIQEALAAAKAAVGAVKKTGRNTQQNYNFRGIDAVVNAASPELNKAGVIVMPMLQSIEYDTVEVGQKRTPMAHVRVRVIYRFHGPAGDYLDAEVPGESMDSGDKATPKAMSVAYRIALLQALNLPTDDADPDSQSYERSPQESFENARPANGNGNGRSNGHAVRPAQQAAQPAQSSGEPDPDAQQYADEAHEARTLGALQDIQKRAREAGKLTALIVNPATQGKGRLAEFIDFHRKRLTEIDAALALLNDVAKKKRTTIGEVEIQLKLITGKGIEDATPAEMRSAAEQMLAEVAA